MTCEDEFESWFFVIYHSLTNQMSQNKNDLRSLWVPVSDLRSTATIQLSIRNGNSSTPITDGPLTGNQYSFLILIVHRQPVSGALVRSDSPASETQHPDVFIGASMSRPARHGVRSKRLSADRSPSNESVSLTALPWSRRGN